MKATQQQQQPLTFTVRLTCPTCNSEHIRVRTSRELTEHKRERRWQCQSCNERFVTVERPAPLEWY